MRGWVALGGTTILGGVVFHNTKVLCGGQAQVKGLNQDAANETVSTTIIHHTHQETLTSMAASSPASFSSCRVFSENTC